MKGQMRWPVNTVFAENKLVVSGYAVDSPDLRALLPVGSVIRRVDGIAVDSLVKRYLAVTPASNFPTQQRDLSSIYGWLMRSNAVSMMVEAETEDGVRTVRLDMIARQSPQHGVKAGPLPADPGYVLLDKDIGYIKPSRLKESDLDSIQDLFAGTRGVIEDLRCYPSTFLPFTYGSWLKAERSSFARFSRNDLVRPGTFVRGESIMNGGGLGIPPGKWEALGRGSKCYKGKLVIIVDATTQSSAEYTTMALQTTPGAVVIGSTTAGADGNVSSIYLPGNIFSYMSGIGVYYPDGAETQRVGVRVDQAINITVKGIRDGRDELLDEAKRIVMESRTATVKK
jgi:hypothetical protein